MAINRESLLKTLTDFGLSDKEALVYLTSLELGPSTVLKISRMCDLKRPTVYLIVDSLAKKGLMVVEVKGFKKTYKAENPDRLEAIFNQRKRELLKNLPFFQEIYDKEKSSSFIKYYEGVEAIKLIYADLLKELKSGDEYLVVSNTDSWLALDEKFFKKFIEDRAKLNLKTRLILQDTPSTQEFKKYERNFNQEIKLIPPNVDLTTNLTITPGKILIHEMSTPTTAVVIENKNVAKMNKEMFEIMWGALA